MDNEMRTAVCTLCGKVQDNAHDANLYRLACATKLIRLYKSGTTPTESPIRPDQEDFDAVALEHMAGTQQQ